MGYTVIAECVDLRDGSRYVPGDAFPDPTDDQVETLTAAGCIAADDTPKAKKVQKLKTVAAPAVPTALPDYDRDGLATIDLATATPAQLAVIAAREGVTVDPADAPAAVIAAIEAKRVASKPA